MISIQKVHRFCKDDISKIENYDKAIADTAQTWDYHHRLELTLNGEFAHSREELKRLGMYYNRPYFELIFLTTTEHQRLHKTRKPLTAEHRQKISEAIKGKTLCPSYIKKLSESHKGKTHTIEQRKKLSDSLKGHTVSDKTRKKLSDALKGKTNKALSERSDAYRQYKSEGGTMNWNEFQRSAAAKEYKC